MKIEKDILFGTWVGGADDGSGLRTMIYNYGVTFNDDGTGLCFSWNKENDEIEESESKIEWKFVQDKTIGIRYISGENDSYDWENMEIEISDFIGAYESKHYKIVSKGKDTFWDFPEPLYRSKYRVKKKGIFERIWKTLKEKLPTTPYKIKCYF